MAELNSYKCKNCGSELDLGGVINNVLCCEYCHSVFTMPKEETSPEALSFLRMGELELETCSFEKAYTAFSKAAKADPKEAEAYFGMALAKFCVQYVKDEVNNRLQPICHEISKRDFLKDANYRRALELATPQQKAEYEKKGEAIADIHAKFYEYQQSGLDYDCFICVKVTEPGKENEKTEDYREADRIYDFLRKRDFVPFFSERTLVNKTGIDYEAMILFALYTSETMIIVCSNESYLETPWMKNEYLRFTKLVREEEKETDSLTIAYRGTPVEKLPGRLGKIQGIDLSDSEAYLNIYEFVETHTPIARSKREEARRRVTAPVHADSAMVDTYLKKAGKQLAVGEYQKAATFYDLVLEEDPKNADAYWGMFLTDFKIKNESELAANLNAKTVVKIVRNRNYKNAILYDEDGVHDRFNVRVSAYLETLRATTEHNLQELQAKKKEGNYEKRLRDLDLEIGELKRQTTGIPPEVDQPKKVGKGSIAAVFFLSIVLFDIIFMASFGYMALGIIVGFFVAVVLVVGKKFFRTLGRKRDRINLENYNRNLETLAEKERERNQLNGEYKKLLNEISITEQKLEQLATYN